MPLTDKGQKILASMQRQYGDKKGKSVFYASVNAGKITGVEGYQAGGEVNARDAAPPVGDQASPAISEADYNYINFPWMRANLPTSSFAQANQAQEEGLRQTVQNLPAQQAGYNYINFPWMRRYLPQSSFVENFQAGGEVAGLVDHDRDPELPRTPEAARLIPMLPLPSGYRDPAYISVIQRLIEGQRRLNAMNPVVRENLRRYWAGGLVRHFRLGGRV
jgi:hypothetical protein